MTNDLNNKKPTSRTRAAGRGSESPAGEAERFLEVFMDQNNLCNLRCTMCAFSDPRVAQIGKHLMPIRLFEKIAREVFQHATYLTLSCLTEPLMSRDFPERLEILKSYPVPFTEMITNGQLLNERVIRKMIEVPLHRIGISIDGATAETYERIRQRASFSRLLEKIELLQRLKRQAGSSLPQLRVNLVISEINIDEYEDVLALAESLGAGAIDVRTIIPFRNAVEQGTEADAFWVRIRECRTYLREWCRRTGIEDVGYLRQTPEEVVLFESGRKVICKRPWNTAAIHFNGDVQICSSWMRGEIGNLARQSFEEIWSGEPLAAIRREFEQQQPGPDCQHCTIKMPPNEVEDGFFLMLSKSPAELTAPFEDRDPLGRQQLRDGASRGSSDEPGP